MIAGRNIVCIASSWFDHPTSKHHLMRILAEQNHVVWVSCHASRRPSLSTHDARAVLRRLRQAWAGPQRVRPNLDVLSPVLIPLPTSPWARRVNAGLLARRIRRVLSRGLQPARPGATRGGAARAEARGSSPTQLWLFAPDVPELIAHLRPERTVYYCADDFAAFDGFDAACMEQLEARTIAASDLVITTSQELYDTRRRQHPHTHLVPHGVDFDHFAAAVDVPADRIPADIRNVPHPVLGYFGLISDYVDLDLIAAAARRKPEWSFVLIGDRRRALAPLSGLPNVHALGGRPYEQLPAYCRAFDVGLIPFRMNRLVRAVNPIKLGEYLAAGLPVVSAPMPAVLEYAPAVRTAETADEFIAACAAALRETDDHSRRARQKLVRSESWRRRVEWLSQLVTTGDEPVAVPPPVPATVGSAA